MITPSDSEFLRQADFAERHGDRTAAAAKLRAYLALHSQDGAVRLRLARLLVDLQEAASAREVLLPLDQGDAGVASVEANRLLASLDESEGALSAAQLRWERVLADDIDDSEAHARLRGLRPRLPGDDWGWPTTLSVGTLASPEGVRLSRFKMERELGRGSTAAVYLVRDERLNLPLALKVLHPQLAAAARTAARERFFAEARLAARLRHPGVVAIYGVDEAARCVAMEYVAGGTLRDRLRAQRDKAGVPVAGDNGLPVAEVLSIARSLLEALAYVHDAGVAHGDLKPGNLLLRSPTEVVLADFGAAALAADVATGSDRGAGTPLYLAPEQFRGAVASTETDLFAAGAILWETLHGRPVRRQTDLMAGLYGASALAGAPTASSASPDVPSGLTSLIEALISTEPAERPPSAGAALAVLRDLPGFDWQA